MKRKPAPKPPVITPPESDPAELAYQHQAEQAREATWQRDGEWIWHDQPLKPWTRERESLFARLIENDEGNRSLDDLALMQARLDANHQTQLLKDKSAVRYAVRDLADSMLFIEQASLLLFLASHEPEQWDHLRGKPAAFLRASAKWAETVIQLGEEWDAIFLAAEIRTAHRVLVPIRKPTPGTRGGSEGN